jgi:UDP-N-acetylmuramoylalanine--D-glutamate ligase
VNVVVLGAAVSGSAAARLALRTGHNVVVYDRDVAALASVPEAADRIGGEWDGRILAGADLVVTSPGIPEHAAPIRDALAGTAPLVSELEFAASHLASPYVAVTGTNGKTTVTEATAAMLTASGLTACAAGNVGLALSDVALEPWDCVAVEASSFQLRFIDRFHPKAAAILNIAPDHLDWHGGFGPYAAAKSRIYENQTGDDVLVYDADDAAASEAALRAPVRTVPVSGDHRPLGGNGPDGDRLIVGALTFPIPQLDKVWLVDLTVAATLAVTVGAEAGGIAHVLGAFTPPLHRRTLVADIGGVAWVNDSKATNPHAAVKAASAYPSVVLIAGGRNKGLDLQPMVEVASVRHVVAIGEAADELIAAGGAKVSRAADMKSAVEAAARIAVRGDTVLLAPGCASFDMFEDYRQRGAVFTELVDRLAGDRS